MTLKASELALMEAEPPAARTEAEVPDAPSAMARWTALGLLFLVSMFNYVDRTILSILQVPIKAELGLTDSQIGVLTGMGFAFFYTIFGLPLARVADSRARKNVIIAALAIWSAMTALTGLATGFLSLLLLRIGVAFGEAGSVPASHSIISDMFSPVRRGNALSVWGLSLPIGTMIGFISAGWLTRSVGWREAFVFVGVAGLLLAPILLVALKEPRRGRYDPPTVTMDQIPLREAVGILWRSKGFCCVALGAALFAFVQFVMLTWNAPFYVRIHHMPLMDAAFYLALLNGVGGGLGLYLGGVLSDAAGRRKRRYAPMVPAVGGLLLAPFALIQYWLPSWQASLLFAIVPSVAVYMYYAPAVALSHMLVPARMRAFTSAVLVLVVNIIGMGLGPLVTGVLSDALTDHAGMGTEALRYAIAVSSLVSIAGGLLFWRASHHIAAEEAAHRI